MMLMYFVGIPYMLRIFHSDGLWRLSKAFWKSTKFMTRFNCISVDSSMIVLKVNMWSVVERCGLKPACSSLSLSSMDFLSLSSRMLRKTFPGIDSSVIPRQLLQSVRLPFFGSFTMVAFFHCFGGDSFCQTWLYKDNRCLRAL